MIGLMQRVTHAEVTIAGATTASIDEGLLVLVGFRSTDRAERIPRFVQKLLDYRIFADAQGRMNRSLRDTEGQLLLVPQFTLAADTRSGNRPSFSPAAAPEFGRQLFESLQSLASQEWPGTRFGSFGADMKVGLVNDGPVTFWVEVD